MNVGMTTATATIQGLTARRLTTFKVAATLLIGGSFWVVGGEGRGEARFVSDPSCVNGRHGRRGRGPPRRDLPGAGHGGALEARAVRLQDLTGVRTCRRLLVVHVGGHRQTDEQRGLVGVVIVSSMRTGSRWTIFT